MPHSAAISFTEKCLSCDNTTEDATADVDVSGFTVAALRLRAFACRRSRRDAFNQLFHSLRWFPPWIGPRLTLRCLPLQAFRAYLQTCQAHLTATSVFYYTK